MNEVLSVKKARIRKAVDVILVVAAVLLILDTLQYGGIISDYRIYEGETTAVIRNIEVRRTSVNAVIRDEYKLSYIYEVRSRKYDRTSGWIFEPDGFTVGEELPVHYAVSWPESSLLEYEMFEANIPLLGAILCVAIVAGIRISMRGMTG